MGDRKYVCESERTEKKRRCELLLSTWKFLTSTLGWHQTSWLQMCGGRSLIPFNLLCFHREMRLKSFAKHFSASYFHHPFSHRIQYSNHLQICVLFVFDSKQMDVLSQYTFWQQIEMKESKTIISCELYNANNRNVIN